MHRTILLVEDDPDLRATIRELLEDEGWEVVTASTAPDAATAGRGADIALVDLHLGGVVVGSDTVAAIRSSLPPGARVYLVSGDRDLAARARSAGADGFLEKPFNVDALFSLLAQAMPPAAP